MNYTKEDVDRIIDKRCLPEEFRQDVENIIAMKNRDDALNELDVMTAKCYRFEPDHERYDRDRARFPKFDD